jgi:hypothetical protein
MVRAQSLGSSPRTPLRPRRAAKAWRERAAEEAAAFEIASLQTRRQIR